MASYTYIKLDNKKKYITFSEPFDPALYTNLGTTWEDYIGNKWVLLSPEQVAFHNEHPELGIYDVWRMIIPTPHERTLEEAKEEMINTINNYDNSESVNSFIVRTPSVSEEAVDGYVEITAWITQQERSNYRSSIDSAKLLGVETLSLYIGDMPVTLSTTDAESMLAHIQLYADACFIVTKQHKTTVRNLMTIEAVDSYDYQSGYPETLVFTLSA